MKQQIKNINGKTLFETECETIKQCVEIAVKEYANLQGSDLRRADLRKAIIDYSSWPLWCGSTNIKGDTEQKKQILAHAPNFALDEFPGGLTQEQKDWLNEFHRIQSNEFPKFE